MLEMYMLEKLLQTGGDGILRTTQELTSSMLKPLA
jgi:hypothetical protein